MNSIPVILGFNSCVIDINIGNILNSVKDIFCLFELKRFVAKLGIEFRTYEQHVSKLVLDIINLGVMGRPEFHVRFRTNVLKCKLSAIVIMGVHICRVVNTKQRSRKVVSVISVYQIRNVISFEIWHLLIHQRFQFYSHGLHLLQDGITGKSVGKYPVKPLSLLGELFFQVVEPLFPEDKADSDVG